MFEPKQEPHVKKKETSINTTVQVDAREGGLQHRLPVPVPTDEKQNLKSGDISGRVSFIVIVVGVLSMIALFGAGIYVGLLYQPDITRVTGLSDLQVGAPKLEISQDGKAICKNENGEKISCGEDKTGVVAIDAKDTANFAAFWKAWNILNTEYVDPKGATSQEKVWGAIQGLASSYGDPYTFFMPPSEAKIFQDDVKGAFGGVGMQVGSREGNLVIIAPLKGSPAEKAGIKAGDIILQIDDATTTGMTVDKAIYIIRGDIDTKVRLLIARKGEEKPLKFEIIRQVIAVPTIDTKKRDDGIFVVSLYGFPESGAGLFRDALREFLLSRGDKMVIDLRGNPGGYLEIAQELASWFLPSGKVIVREETREGEGQTFRSRGYDVFGSRKLVILIDEGSASAAEIFAGALAEHGKAIVVGKRSFGKGSVQKLEQITDDTVLKVTVARWVLPSGKHLSHVAKDGEEAGGIEPDFVVDITKEDVEKGIDPQMDKAVEVLKNWDKVRPTIAR